MYFPPIFKFSKIANFQKNKARQDQKVKNDQFPLLLRYKSRQVKSERNKRSKLWTIFNISIISLIENYRNRLLQSNVYLPSQPYFTFPLPISKIPITRIARAERKIPPSKATIPSITKRTTLDSAKSKRRNPLSYTVHRKFRRD